MINSDTICCCPVYFFAAFLTALRIAEGFNRERFAGRFTAQLLGHKPSPHFQLQPVPRQYEALAFNTRQAPISGLLAIISGLVAASILGFSRDLALTMQLRLTRGALNSRIDKAVFKTIEFR